jgi:hypothetical protein
MLPHAALVEQAGFGVKEIEHRLDESRRLPFRFGHLSSRFHSPTTAADTELSSRRGTESYEPGKHYMPRRSATADGSA